MDPSTSDTLKQEVDRGLEKLTQLNDEARVKLHLASLDAKKEWDEKLSPRLAEVQQMAKNVTESSRSALKQLIQKIEDFVAHLRDASPHSPR